MPLRRDAKVELLHKVPLFDRVSRREMAKIAALAMEVSYPAGAALLRQGSRDDGFFILLNGEVDVRQGARLVQTLRRGQFFGEIGLLANVTRTATHDRDAGRRAPYRGPRLQEAPPELADALTSRARRACIPPADDCTRRIG